MVFTCKMGIKTPSGSLRGNDQRAIYLDTDKGSTNAYVMTNSNKGYVYNTSLKCKRILIMVFC
jgi:hypothetical protein